MTVALAERGMGQPASFAEVAARLLPQARAIGNIGLSGYGIEHGPELGYADAATPARRLKRELQTSGDISHEEITQFCNDKLSNALELLELQHGNTFLYRQSDVPMVRAVIERGLRKSEENSEPFEIERNYTFLEQFDTAIVPMMAGETDHDTVFCVSPLPEEYIEPVTGVLPGYNTEERWAMLQIAHRTGKGELLFINETLPGSYIEAIKLLLEDYDSDPSNAEITTDLIAISVALKVGDGEVFDLANQIKRKYADILEASGLAETGWLEALRSGMNAREALLREKDLLDWYLEKSLQLAIGRLNKSLREFISVASELTIDKEFGRKEYIFSSAERVRLQRLVANPEDWQARDEAQSLLQKAVDYMYVQKAEKRLLGEPEPLVVPRFDQPVAVGGMSAMDRQMLHEMQRGVQEGKTRNGCGGTIKLGSGEATEPDDSFESFVDKENHSNPEEEVEDYDFSLGHCVVHDPEARYPQEYCGPCGLCGTRCDKDGFKRWLSRTGINLG